MTVRLPSRFRLIREIGSGRSATVWLARDTRTGSDVAVKVMDLSPSMPPGALGEETWEQIVGRRFEAELRSLGRLRDIAGICQVLQAGLDQRSIPWLVTEFLPGGSLTDRIEGPTSDCSELGATDCCSLFVALGEAHEAGVFHGDISPNNIIFDSSGSPVIVDFGMSDLIGFEETVASVGLTPAFAAPERIRGARPSGPSDVYALASTLLEVLPNGETRLTGLLERARVADPTKRPTAAKLARDLRRLAKPGSGTRRAPKA
ncbi:MAG: serine/threonine protein kinase [Microthrixaceae bacterium]|nr:serine/threonine protein kinase [Microthrixaceae bacterium]